MAKIQTPEHDPAKLAEIQQAAKDAVATSFNNTWGTLQKGQYACSVSALAMLTYMDTYSSPKPPSVANYTSKGFTAWTTDKIAPEFGFVYANLADYRQKNLKDSAIVYVAMQLKCRGAIVRYNDKFGVDPEGEFRANKAGEILVLCDKIPSKYVKNEGTFNQAMSFNQLVAMSRAILWGDDASRTAPEDKAITTLSKWLEGCDDKNVLEFVDTNAGRFANLKTLSNLIVGVNNKYIEATKAAADKLEADKATAAQSKSDKEAEKALAKDFAAATAKRNAATAKAAAKVA